MDEKLRLLLEKYLTDSLDSVELAQLYILLNNGENQDTLNLYMDEYISDIPAAMLSFGADREKSAFKLLAKIKAAGNASIPTADLKSAAGLSESPYSEDNDLATVPLVHRINFIKAPWFRYAAVLLLITGSATFLYLANQKTTNVNIAAVKQAIAPGGNRAILTLANGSTIILDTAANGPLAQQGNTRILKSADGSLSYHAGKSDGELLYNTISTPKGGQYQITLPDRTRVWLNAASSISFPAAFSGKYRKVLATGEVYFEIVPDKTKPFYVDARGTEIQVLGTSFNINAYTNEASINTTLLEGSVRINALKNSQQLKPGQQLQVTSSGELKIINSTDIDKIMAWKNGQFNFEGSTLREVMRQLERWYDIKVEYEKDVPDIEFVGKLNRNISFKDLLEILERMRVGYRLEPDRKLVITH